MNLIPKFLRPYPTLRLFGRPVRVDDMKVVDPDPDMVRPDSWAAAAQRLRDEGIGREPEPAHPDVVVLRVVPTEPASIAEPVQATQIARASQVEWDAYLTALRAEANPDSSAYRPVCSHEGLNEWGSPPSFEQTTADIRAITIPALTAAEIIANALAHPMIERMEAARNGTAKRDSKGRFLKRTTNGP